MIKRIVGIFALGLTIATVIVGCGSQGKDSDVAVLKPGVYTGQSSNSTQEEGGGYTIVRLTVGNNSKIEKMEYDVYEKNGQRRLSDSGVAADAQSDGSQEEQLLSDISEACNSYREQFLETGSMEEVDALGGATVSYNQFKEAVGIALDKASAESD